MAVSAAKGAVFAGVLAALVGTWLAGARAGAAGEERPWRAAWCGLKNVEGLIAAAKDLRFSALIAHGPKEKMKAFAESAQQNGIESYYWFSITAPKDMAGLAQRMTPEDDKQAAAIAADKDPRKSGYQFGGEPLPGRHDVLLQPLLCFHRAKVKEYCEKQIREMLEAAPALTGVAFDFFGYQNLRCCTCPASQQLLNAWRAARPTMDEAKALEEFSRNTLVDFTNQMAEFVRKTRPGAKVAIHVYPTLLSEPLYGNRLNVDYCCQTVAWFFDPYWSAEKVAAHARAVVNEEGRHFPSAKGIPFVGVYVGRAYADKKPERLAEELRIIREAAGTTRLSIYRFEDVIENRGLRQVVAEWVK